jgi:aromatic-L-amino-acid/L-tryptophan decarboxylase
MKCTPDIEALRNRRAPLVMEAAEFRRVGHCLVDQISDRLERLPQGAVTRAESPADVRRLLDAGRRLPSGGSDAADLVSDATDLLFEHSLFNGHPRFFGYITSSPAPIAMFADFIAAAVNQNVGAWNLSPMASEIEAQTVRWIAQLIGFPETCGGLMVSGGNMANFVGLLAARAARAPWDVRKEGLSRAERLTVYASLETHTWLQKAVDMSGLGTNAIRWIATDAEQRMDPSALRRAVADDIQAGHQPFLVVGTAGTVSTGAVDPLQDIAAICRAHGLWFHVDGAYGALAAKVPGAPAALAAMSDADSVAVDPHKWLYAPLEAGCVLVRDAGALRRAFAYHPPYYRFDEKVVNYFEQGPQNSRGFKALKVWLAMRQVGRDGYLRMIAADMLLATQLHRLANEHPELDAMTQSLSITTFRYVPRDLAPLRGTAAVETYLNELNQQVLAAVEESGEAFLSNAVINGVFALRACIVNFNTSLDDIEAVPTIVARSGQALDAKLRTEWLAS